MKHTGCVHMDPATVTDPHPPSGRASPARDYHDWIDTLADKVEAKVIEIRHDLHQNPELPNREFRTAKIIAEHVAQALGLTAEVTFDQAVPAVYNDPKWLERFLPTMERIFGHENMRTGPPQMAYDDHSCFQIACGGVYLFLGAQDTKWTENGLESIDPNKPVPFNHNPHYYVKDEVLKTGIRMHANVVMDFLTGQI